MYDDNALINLGLLMLPDRRTACLDRLRRMGALSAESRTALERMLACGRYSERALFRSLAPVKLALDAMAAENEFSKFSPERAIRQIVRFRAVEPAAFDPGRFTGCAVLDYGAGQLCPISVAILLYVNGAGRIVSFEPGGWQADHARTATRELVADLLMAPGRYDFAGNGAAAIRRRVAELNLDKAAFDNPREADFGPITLVRNRDRATGPFDLILSNSVLEHVPDVAEAMCAHHYALRSGGVSINSIDFTDHRHSRPDKHPFGFYADGDNRDCNMLRVCDYEAAAEALGIDYDIRTRALADPSAVDFERLLPRFAGYDSASLLTAGAVLLIRKPE